MDTWLWQVGAQVLASVISIAVAVVAAIRVARKEQADKSEAQFEKIFIKLTEMEGHLDAKVETQRLEIGEVAHALREKINQVERKHQELEIFVRDHFVSKEDFKSALQDLKLILDKIERKLFGTGT